MRRLLVPALLRLALAAAALCAVAAARGAPQAPMPPQAPAEPADYVTARATACRERRPLVVWVGREAEAGQVPGCVCTTARRLLDVRAGVAVCVPDGEGDLEWTATLPADATAERIGRAVEAGREKVRRRRQAAHDHGPQVSFPNATPQAVTFYTPPAAFGFPAAGPPRGFLGAGFGGFRGGNCGPSG